MSFTRFHDDPTRIRKQLQQSSGLCRYQLDAPGPGILTPFIEDPQVRLQKWGANLRTNTINLESELRGVNKPLSRDCLGKDEYKNFNVSNEAIKYPTCSNLFTDQSRATNPAWWYRDVEQTDWYYPPLNPQENTCLPFQNNLSTRILEKDYYTPKRDCVVNETKNLLPSSYNLIRGGYVGGPNTCQQTNSCQNV